MSHCENINEFSNVKVIKHNGVNMKNMRDDGLIKEMIDAIFLSV